MRTIVQRLQIIQSALILEDTALITNQSAEIAKIIANGDPAEIDPLIVAISAALTAADYPQAQEGIAHFLRQQTALQDDPARSALKMQLIALEQRCSELNHQHDDIIRRIENFNRAYYRRLGGLIEKILQLRLLIAFYHTLQDPTTQQKFATMKAEWQQFHEQHANQLATPAPRPLNPDETQRLKKAYHHASRLCHPDRVAEELKTQAAEQFKKLNAAYRQNDVPAVENILHQLQNGGGFATLSAQSNDKARLQEKIAFLQQRIAQLEREICTLKNDESYQLLASLPVQGEEDYFAQQEPLLHAQWQALQQQLWQLIAP